MREFITLSFTTSKGEALAKSTINTIVVGTGHTDYPP